MVNERSTTGFEITSTQLVIADAEKNLARDFRDAFGWGEEFMGDRLSEWGYANDGRLSIAGALRLVSEPDRAPGKTFVEYLRFADEETVDYELRREIRGPLPLHQRFEQVRAEEVAFPSLAGRPMNRHPR